MATIAALTLSAILLGVGLRRVMKKYMTEIPSVLLVTKVDLPMKQYVPVEPSIEANKILSVQIVTTALLEDGSTATVPNGTAEGDYLIYRADSTFELTEKTVFETRYKAA
jgi:hypothetical protein